jgi:hypothetical protein
MEEPQVSISEELVRIFKMIPEGVTKEADDLLDYIMERLRALDMCWAPTEGE